MVTMLSTSAIASTAVCSTSGDCRPTQRLLIGCFETFSLPTRCPYCPYRKYLAAPDILLCRSCPALRTRGQLEKDGSPLPACTPGRVLPSHITIGETVLKTVHQFTYLGCTITSDAKIDREVDNRLAKSNSAFGRLSNRIWKNKDLKKFTKISVYRAVVLITLLYGSESWVIYLHHLRPLERFHQRCLRIILNIHWSDYVSNVEVLEQAEITSIEAILLKSQLRWAGHVYKMDDHRLPKIALYGELSTDHGNRRAPKKRYKDSLKKSLGACHIDPLQWSTLAADRVTWRHVIHQAVSSFEDSRKNNLREKRCRRKNREASTTTVPGMTFDCSRCGRTCLSRIGLVSHERACSRRGQPPS